MPHGEEAVRHVPRSLDAHRLLRCWPLSVVLYHLHARAWFGQLGGWPAATRAFRCSSTVRTFAVISARHSIVNILYPVILVWTMVTAAVGNVDVEVEGFATSGAADELK